LAYRIVVIEQIPNGGRFHFCRTYQSQLGPVSRLSGEGGGPG
jgi:hypothetical protein